MINSGVITILLNIFNIFKRGADLGETDLRFFELEIQKWKNSPARLAQIRGQMYYEGIHDILFRERTVIGEDGTLETVKNLPNNRIIDNQYAKMVDQKTNYLLGKPFVIASENKEYSRLVGEILGKRFKRTLKSAGKALLNSGIVWIYPNYNGGGELDFKLFSGYEILPFWKDAAHTLLDCAVRLYEVVTYENDVEKIVEKVEIFTQNGIRCYILQDGRLIPDNDAAERDCAYVMCNGKPFNWDKIPLIPLKNGEYEIPLLNRVKALQDGINAMLSDFQNNMQEDSRNTILVLRNYDGTNLGEFRRNLSVYGAVKVRSDGEGHGGVDTLEVEVNSENYAKILELLKKALIENAMGYDAKDDRLSGNPNQLNIRSMYSDIDLDANDLETELQAVFEEIMWFVNVHLANTGKGDFSGEEINFVFNRDILINESEAIDNCSKSVGILSDETIVEQHPWIDDPEKELKRIKKQQEEAISGGYDNGFHEVEDVE